MDLWRCGRIRCLHLIQVLRFRVLGASFSRFGCFVFEFWVLRFRDRVLRFRDLGASFSSFGSFVLRSSFSSASFSKLPAVGWIRIRNALHWPDKTADFLRSHHWFPCRMTSEERAKNFPANDAPSPRQGSGASSVWNFSIVFLGCYFTGKPVVVWQNFVCFYTLALYLNFFP